MLKQTKLETDRDGMRTQNKAILGLSIVLVLVTVSFIDVIPNDAMTLSSMNSIEHRIKPIVDQLAGKTIILKDLPERPGYSNEVTDGWGNPIGVTQTSTTITLTSAGEDESLDTPQDNIIHEIDIQQKQVDL